MTCCFPWPFGLAGLMLRYRRPIQLARRLTSPAGSVAILPSALWQSAQEYQVVDYLWIQAVDIAGVICPRASSYRSA